TGFDPPGAKTAITLLHGVGRERLAFLASLSHARLSRPRSVSSNPMFGQSRAQSDSDDGRDARVTRRNAPLQIILGRSLDQGHLRSYDGLRRPFESRCVVERRWG